MSDFKLNCWLLAEAAGIDLAHTTPEIHHKISLWSVRLSSASRIWPRPDQIEVSIEEVLKDIRSLKRNIKALDPFAMSLARTSERREAEAKFVSDMRAADGDRQLEQVAIDELVANSKSDRKDWVDIAALRHLDALEAALVVPVESAIAETRHMPESKGAKPNLAVRAVALVAARALVDLTGKPVSYWRGATSFAKLTEAVFEVLDIRADTRRACEWALSELEKSA